MEVDLALMPDFLIIGAAKSGTTSLHRYLSQHPQVFMPANKEPEFFARVGRPPNHSGPGDDSIKRTAVTDLKEYQALFERAGAGSVKGEASPVYLYSEEAVKHIARFVPNAKMIAVLRNPIERAYSHFKHFKRDGREFVAGFRESINREKDRIEEDWLWGWHYVQVGYYGRQLQRYLSVFDAAQLKVFMYEQLRHDIGGVLREVFEFIGVDSSVQCDTSFKYNVSGKPRSRLIHRAIYSDYGVKEAVKAAFPETIRRRLVNRIKQKNLRPFPPMDKADRTYLEDLYHEDILLLESLLGRDLSHWLKGVNE